MLWSRLSRSRSRSTSGACSFDYPGQGSHGHIRIPLDVLITGEYIKYRVYILLIYSFGPITFQDGGSGYQTNKRPTSFKL